MQLGSQLSISIAVAFVVLLLALWRVKSRTSRNAERPISRGPGNMRFVCGRCSGQFTHTKRTVTAWEKGSRRVFCDACHKKWRNAQPPQAQSDQAATSSSARTPSREFTNITRPVDHSSPRSQSGCLVVAILIVVIPAVLFTFAAHA